MMPLYVALQPREFPELPCPHLHKAQAACSRMSRSMPSLPAFGQIGASTMLWMLRHQAMRRWLPAILNTAAMYTARTAHPATEQQAEVEVRQARLWMNPFSPWPAI